MLGDCAERFHGVGISLEVEKPRPGIQTLFNGPDVLIFSRTYVRDGGYADPKLFLQDQWRRTGARLLVLPWGADGAFAQSRGGSVCFAPAQVPAQVRDTLGAGDVFNAGVIDALLAGLNAAEMLLHANALAGQKCGMTGFDGLVANAREAGMLKIDNA
jgi:ketohexokinase